MPRRPPFGVLGVFLVLLGAGVVLDGDWMWRGGVMMVAGAAFLALEWQRP